MTDLPSPTASTAPLCFEVAARCLQVQLAAHGQTPRLAIVSLALGVFEQYFTSDATAGLKADQYEVEVKGLQHSFEAFVDSLARQLEDTKIDASNTRGVVKAVADVVWSKLTGVFSKDIHHAQHVSCFLRHLSPSAAKGKRQLDCAGVVTTVLAICQHLALSYEQFAHLADLQFQVSEDHCWLSMGPDSGSREASIEVTTDQKAKRGQAVSEDAWRTWLYSGGKAVLCTPQMALTALVASLNPAINPRQNSGTDSEEVQELQKRLLTHIHEAHPQAMYPAALCTLADLHEIAEQDELDAAARAADRMPAALQLADPCASDSCNAHPLSKAQALFAQAVGDAKQERFGAMHAWYPFSYAAGFHARRAAWCLQHSGCQLPDMQGSDDSCRTAGKEHLTRALRYSAAEQGAAVLQKYRYATHDEQLYKDVEGLLELLCSTIGLYVTSASASDGQQPLSNADWFGMLLELFDGMCWLMKGRAKPGHWVSCLLKTAKLFSGEARTAAASANQVSSKPMVGVASMWGPLKYASIKAVLEPADIEESAPRPSKRSRH